MASTSQLDLFGENAKRTRKSYTREFKLSVVTWYRQHNLYTTSKKFSLNTKTILRWAAAESEIKKSKKGSKHMKHTAKGEHHEMEAALYQKYKELRRKGLKVKGYWFKLRARQLLTEMNPETSFKFSDGWFTAFKTRYKISLRRRTNTSQKAPDDKVQAIQSFHNDIRKVAALSDGDEQHSVGRFKLCQIANMDQTPLPFSFTSGDTYADTGDKTVWIRGGASGMDKRQCTVQALCR